LKISPKTGNARFAAPERGCSDVSEAGRKLIADS